MVSTLVCDEQLIFAESLAAALLRYGGDAVDVVAHPEQAVAALSAAAPSVAAPSVAAPSAPGRTLVMSLRSAPQAGLDAVRQVRHAWPQSRIVCLTAGADNTLDRRAVEAGADEVIVRTRPLTDLVAAVLASPADWVPLQRRRAASAPGTAPRRVGEDLPLRFLTARERQAFELLVAAKPTESIAQEMDITMATARSYVQSVLEKLGVHSRVQVVAYAARQSLVLPDDSRCC